MDNTYVVSNVLSGYWDHSGLEEGDTVLIHSSMRRTLRHLISLGSKPEPGLIVDSLLEQIGNSGTLLFPLFNFEFPDTKYFSINHTPSQMGVLTEFVRKNYSGVRTGHPIYSFYAIGANAPEFSGIDNKSGYGIDSPFARLRQLAGKIGIVDLDDQNSMTSYHHVEEMLSVDYRYFKDFSGEYVNSSSESSEKTYSLFVRDINRGVTTDVNRMGEILWNEGLYKGFREGIGNGLRTIDAQALFDRTSIEILEGRALETLYSITK
jgi:aminoglycoside 3-N-acetyltransferase